MSNQKQTSLENLSEKELIVLVKNGVSPRHIAVIMDGNGRWAEKKGLTRISGHREGIHSVREIITLCRELEIDTLTIYAFSVENWKRPALEIKTLMCLLEEYLKKELKTLMDNDIRFRTLGRIEELPLSVIQYIKKVERETRNNKKMRLNIALNYGGRSEIIDAIVKFNDDVQKGTRAYKELDENLFSNYLYTEGLPDPDLMIRTSGEERISNFLLWQMAYTELYFTKTLWPDFRRKNLLLAILDFQRRERRFGKVVPEIYSDPQNVKL
ncbi:MAG: isoprenyl transferase [Nitrospirae bacterium]|nr:isoprenyl transferase [Nitrospirota bacterium]MBI3351716.1 isoprenyl transferase [Nitrospirota bacterium]